MKVSIVVLALLLSACGQKGPLYLAEPETLSTNPPAQEAQENINE